MMETDQTNRPAAEPLFRPANDRVVAGVASAIARRLSIPSWLVRVIFVALAFSGGVGFIAYAAGWLLIPKEGSSRANAGQLLDRIEGPRAWIGVGLVTLAVLVAFESTDLIDADLALAAILIIFGVLLYRGDLGLANTSEEENNMSDTSSSGVRTTAVLETQTGDGPAQPPTPPPVPPVPSAAPAPPVPPAPRQRSFLGRLTIAAGLIILGIMGFLDVADVADIRARHYLGTAVLVVGLGLLVGSFIGRARGLIILGVILVPPLLFSPLGDFDWSAPSVRYSPTTVADIEPSYDADGVDMTIDLSDVEFNGETVSFTADMSIGQLEIIVPDDVSVNATGTVAIGNSQVLGDNNAGLGRMTSSGSIEGPNGQIDIDANLDIGQIEIYVEGNPPINDGDFNVDLGNGGAVEFEIDTYEDLSDSYEVGPGEAVFDFSDLELERTASVDITGDLGTITIILPDNTATAVNASVGVGDLQLPNDRESGIDRDASYNTGPDPLFTINVEMGAGEIIVEEMS